MKIKSLSATFAHPTARMKVLEKHKEGKIQRKLLRYHSFSRTFYIKEELKGSRSPPPPTPYHHTLTPLTNSEPSVTHFVVLTTERENVESEAYSVRV